MARIAGVLGVLFLGVLGFPVVTAAATAYWGYEGGEPERIELVDGGTYAVPFDTPAPLFFVADASSSIAALMTAEGEFLAPVYEEEDAEQYAWTEPGEYQIRITALVMEAHASPKWKFARLFGTIAEADVMPAPPPMGATIRFTIEEAVPEEPECPDPEAEGCYSNVLFLPGIQASRLYTSDGKAWEPGFLDDLTDLYFSEDGTSVRTDVYARERDVLDEDTSGKNYYKSFIEEMDALAAAGTIAEWTPIAYDWRLSIDQVLEGGTHTGDTISYLEATSTPYILQELRRLAGTSKSGKVTIVAHSNGGLIAKRITQILGSEAPELIDRMILVASPQVGTPDAVFTAMHGVDIGPLGVFGSAEAVRGFAVNAPMAYHLMPSEQYFTYVDDPVVSFDPELEEWVAAYGDVVHSEERLRAFVTGSYGKTDPLTGDINVPVQLREAQFDLAAELHDELDVWAPPEGVEVMQIAGWGVDSTITGVSYAKKGDGVDPNPTFTIDGDGTVVVPSALWVSGDVENYWVDLNSFNNERLFRFGPLAISHATIFEIESLRSLLLDSLTGSTASSYSYISQAAPASTGSRLRFELHSPLTIDLYDSSGNHTGVSTTTNEVEEGIPGTYYITFGEKKYIFADSGTSYSLNLDGYDSGTFTLVITETQGDSTISTVSYEDIPVTPETIATLTITSGTETLEELVVDEDGDGNPDFTVSRDGEVVLVQEESAQESVSEPVLGNGPPVSSSPSLPTTESSSTTSAVATTTDVAIPHATTTEAELVSEPAEQLPSVDELIVATSTGEIVGSEVAHVTSPPPAAPIPREESAPPKVVQKSSQVAIAVQVTDHGLWRKTFGWIMKKIFGLYD